jgi:hypothetical protein
VAPGIVPAKVRQVSRADGSMPLLVRSATIVVAVLAAWACATPATGWVRTEAPCQ